MLKQITFREEGRERTFRSSEGPECRDTQNGNGAGVGGCPYRWWGSGTAAQGTFLVTPVGSLPRGVAPELLSFRSPFPSLSGSQSLGTQSPFAGIPAPAMSPRKGWRRARHLLFPGSPPRQRKQLSRPWHVGPDDFALKSY